jgi:hypothetical protein
MKKLLFAPLFLLCILSSGISFAADSTHIKAVLVQLRSEHRRFEALSHDRQYKDLEILKQDAAAVRAAMIADFTDNFWLCPVYFYMDTDADHIIRKEFDGVLLNADGTKVADPIINKNSTDYYIAYYGTAVEQAKYHDVEKDRDRYNSGQGVPLGRGLVIVNDKFEQVNYFYTMGYDHFFEGGKTRLNHKYYYCSKKFEMEYYPFASLFAQKKFERYGNHRVPYMTPQMHAPVDTTE